MFKLSIGQKIFYGFGLVILVSVMFLLIGYPYLAEIDFLSSAVLPLERKMEVLQKCNAKVKKLEGEIELYLMVGSEETKEKALAAVNQLDDFFSKISQEKALKDLRLISGLAGKLSRAARTLINQKQKRQSAYTINLQILNLYELFDRFEKSRLILEQKNTQRLMGIIMKEKMIIILLLRNFLIIELALIFLGSFLAFLLTRLITRDLSKLHRGTQEIAEGNFETKIQISSQDEIGQLANSFNTMIGELRKKTVSKDYLDSIIHSMADMLIVVDWQLRIVKFNRAVEVLLGYRDEELRSEPIRKIFPAERISLGKEELEQNIKEGKLTNYEMYYRTKDNRHIPVLFSASVMNGRKHRPSYIICTAQDITAHKRAEEKEKEVIDMKAKLTSMLSYDLRTRMSSIYTSIYLILNGKVGEITTRQREVLDIAQRNLDKLLHLINNVLDFRRLETDGLELTMRENDVNKIIKEVYREMSPLVEGKELTFRLELSEGLPKIRFDKDRIIQVLSNLVSNAINFTEKGTITVATRKSPEGVQVSVADTGIGIEKKDLQRIFFSFEQFPRSTGGKPQQTSLGLAICQEIIQRHKGRIEVESEVDRGSTFYFVLPY